ncbi:unnamed protein product [Schistocephalus solidus]|uniref:Uncharacterized protein n=1 Tax=Schistocephalus solidus TaxID=70667 RepID=A0A183TTS6_SCHSO|nr:unnamed protein product [Schistocephalus solidus]
MTAKDDLKKYWSGIVLYMEQASNYSDTRKLYQIIRRVSGQPSKPSGFVHYVNGGFMADNLAIVNHWREHFEQLLNFDEQLITPSLSSAPSFIIF